MKKPKPELVSPAGNWPSLMAAVENGADSVYFGIKGFNMRSLASNFDISEVNKVMKYLHDHNKKGYLALNVVVTDKELPNVKKILKKAKASRIDAVVLWDMAVFSLAKKEGLKIHLSTQANVSNVEAISFYSRLGARRIILARECSLQDIKKAVGRIRKKRIKCQIETFIHGAMCVSISGRCFLSLNSFGKSANRGNCLQPCRREFFIRDVDGETEYILGKDYVLSSKDLCAIDFMDKLIEAGISAFKIEGRMRSPEYVKIATSCYRNAIDSYFKKELTGQLKKELKDELYTVYNRGFSTGFYFGIPNQDISRKLEHSRQKVFLGEVTRFFNKISVAEIILRHGSLKTGDEILFIGKHTPARNTIANEMQVDRKFIEKAPKGKSVGIKVPFKVRPKDKIFLWKEV